MTSGVVSKPTIVFTNRRAADSGNIYLLLTADSVTGLTGMSLNTVTLISDLSTGGFRFDTIKSGRLYVGLGTYPNPPLPNGPTYFGWIEFSKTASDDAIWINLTNVDLTGLPLALSGKDSNGKGFSLGLKDPMAPATSTGTILSQLQALLVPDAAAKITCATGQTKILSPTTSPESYVSLEPYLDALCNAGAPLTLVSDVPEGGSAVTFTGAFEKASVPSDIAVNLLGDNGKTLTITKENLSGTILYACDGGYLTYDGVTYPQNRTAKNDPGSTEAERTITNSTFRNLTIGMNEGYLTLKGPNNSTQFPGQIPFANGQGNPYAKVIHETTNSYGFPYADSNLKVLITADPTEALVLTILTDTEAYGYSAEPGGLQPNQPSSGTYQFGIGANSGALGPIRIMNWVYPATSGGAFGGYLPILPDWTQMSFSGLGPEHYIWVKDGQIEQGNCLSAEVTWNGGVADWPANLTWVPGAKPPAKPAS